MPTSRVATQLENLEKSVVEFKSDLGKYVVMCDVLLCIMRWTQNQHNLMII